MIREKETIDLLCKVILIPSDEKWSVVGYFIDTDSLTYNDPNKDIPRGKPYDIYLISPEIGDIREGDVFVEVPNYDELYHCTKIYKDKSDYYKKGLKAIKVNNPDEILTFKAGKIRKVVATSDESNELNLPIIDKEDLKDIILKYNNNNEVLIEISFNIFKRSKQEPEEFLYPQTDSLTHKKVNIVKKSAQEIKIESQATKLWDNKIRKTLSGTCGGFKLYSQFLKSYKDNVEILNHDDIGCGGKEEN